MARHYITSKDLPEFLEKLGDPVTENENKHYAIYYCPYCVECGEPNSKPKFYFYSDTQSGYCFRCQSSVTVVNNFDYSSSEKKKLESDNLVSILSAPQNNTHLVYPSINLDGLSLASEDPDVVQYLKDKRTIDYLPLLESLPAYVITKGYRKGILFPLYSSDKKVIGYQIRYLHEIGDLPRFFTSIGNKVPFRLNPNPHVSEITLCEGIFSSFGCSLLNLPNPIALLGKSTCESTRFFLKEYKPSVIYLAFDSYRINLDLYQELKNVFRNTKFISCTFSNDADPDLAYRTYNKVNMKSLVDREFLSLTF